MFNSCSVKYKNNEYRKAIFCAAFASHSCDIKKALASPFIKGESQSLSRYHLNSHRIHILCLIKYGHQINLLMPILLHYNVCLRHSLLKIISVRCDAQGRIHAGSSCTSHQPVTFCVPMPALLFPVNAYDIHKIEFKI